MVSLINIPGGSSLIYYSEIVSPKEAKIDISANNKLSIKETVTKISNNTINLTDNNSNSFMYSNNKNTINYFDYPQFGEVYNYFNFGNFSNTLLSPQLLSLAFIYY